jgi:hypothetical protein
MVIADHAGHCSMMNVGDKLVVLSAKYYDMWCNIQGTRKRTMVFRIYREKKHETWTYIS